MFDEIYEYFFVKLTEAFPNISIYKGYPFETVMVAPPAIYIECREIQDPEDVPSGEIDITTKWEVRHVVSAKQDRAKIAARNIAAKIGALFHRKFPIKDGFDIKYLGSFDDNFDVIEPFYESWVNDFSLKLRIGTNEFESFAAYPETQMNGVYPPSAQEKKKKPEAIYFENEVKSGS